MNLTGKPRDLQDGVLKSAAKKLSTTFGMQLKELDTGKSGAPPTFVILNKIQDDPRVSTVQTKYRV